MRRVSIHRFGRKRAVAGRVVAALLLCLILVPAPAAQAQSAPYCAQGQIPEFTHGLASLAAQLGTFMGQPTECEHQDRASGDTLQATTTGLAYYRHAANDTAVFTDGQSHVALTDRGLIGWDGPWIDSPLSLPLDGALPTWCSWLSLGQQIVGYLCAYPNNAIGAWSPPPPGANAWLMLGILSSPEAEWQLTAAGRTLLGPAAAIGPPASPAPSSNLAPPPDTYVQVNVDPVNGSAAASFGMITGRVCNQSTIWTASDVRLSFAFVDSSFLATPDRASASVFAVPPNTCAPFAASFSTAYAWQTVKLDSTSFSWRR
jgi:hypothetical protein